MPFEKTEQELCNCDPEKPIRIECYDWNRIGKHDFIGSVEVTLDQLITIENRFDLTSKKGKPSGKLLVKTVEHLKTFTFLDYIRAGLQLSFTVAIDFTGSNLDIKNHKSLHYLSKSKKNPYQKAISRIGNVLQSYNIQKYFPVFGFGGIPKSEKKVSHCFALNNDESSPSIKGIKGILEVYQESLLRTRLSGPTHFAPVIEKVRKMAENSNPHEFYHVLLILTDGVIDDMDETTSVIRNSIRYPLSIIIVGIGEEDFKLMEILDMDRERSKSWFHPEPRRDIVQFVPFKKFEWSTDEFCSEVLKEIPAQITEFMQLIDYRPCVPEQQKIRKIEIPED
jgi:hypothetical protein